MIYWTGYSFIIEMAILLSKCWAVLQSDIFYNLFCKGILLSQYLLPKRSYNSLWHRVDIRIFQCHNNVNFCDNFVVLVIPDHQKSKIWKFYGNIFFLHPLIRVQNTPIEKRYKNFFCSKLGMWHIKIFGMTQGTQIWNFFKCNILSIGNIAKNVILGVNNTPNLPLKLMYFFVFEATDLQSMSNWPKF